MNYKDYYRPKIPPSFSLYNTFAIPTQPTAISMDNTGEANNSTETSAKPTILSTLTHTLLEE